MALSDPNLEKVRGDAIAEPSPMSAPSLDRRLRRCLLPKFGKKKRLPFEIVFGRAYEDKSLQEHLIKESGLDWTIARGPEF